MSFDFDMGKYAAFVWPAYALSAAVLAALVWTTLARARKWRREAERLERKDT
ncbi:MAG: heme exporter protein CcmD [Caulobacteraceae bacterium]